MNATVDFYDDVVESNESNNSLNDVLRIRCKDLVIQSGPTPNNSPPFMVGQNITWSVVVENNGPDEAPESWVGYYVGTTPTDLSNRIGSDYCGVLSNGASTPENDSYTFTSADIGMVTGSI